jgi:DNA-binding CsgD family transcriptional regulator
MNKAFSSPNHDDDRFMPVPPPDVPHDLAVALEAERRRIASLLEDKIINPLNLVLAQAHVYDQTMSDPQVRMVVSVMATLVRQVLQHTRDLEANLSPAVLETLGLEAALEMLISQESRTGGLHITLALQRHRERLPNDIELALFRATQDVIAHLTRHANATTLVIRAEWHDHTLRYSLSANGLPPTAAILSPTQQRINTAGGDFNLSTGRYGGIEVRIEFIIQPPLDLTDREIEVLRYITAGMSNKAIAARLHLSPRTVKFHLDNIFSKLHINTRTEAAVYALRRGIVQRLPDSP